MHGGKRLHTKGECQIQCNVFNHCEAQLNQNLRFLVTICDLKWKNLDVLYGKLEETIYSLTWGTHHSKKKRPYFLIEDNYLWLEEISYLPNDIKGLIFLWLVVAIIAMNMIDGLSCAINYLQDYVWNQQIENSTYGKIKMKDLEPLKEILDIKVHQNQEVGKFY